ncbi:MAG: helix-turn-helix transcriptional regulator [Clostridia bacterium]|nr:helix-turn-helix transcriptional regulator [Clostridia bacterium]
MLGKNRSFGKQHQRRLASYLFLFALLLNITYIPCYFYTRNLTRENVLARHRQKLESGVALLSQAVESVGYLDSLLSGDVHYATLTRRPDTLTYENVDSLRESTRSYLAPYSFVADAGISLAEQILFTQNRLYYQRHLLEVEEYFQCLDLTNKGFLQQFSGAVCVLPSNSFWSHDHLNYKAFTVAWRWSRDKDVYFFLNFPVSQVFAQLAEPDVVRNGSFTVSAGNTVIASVDDAGHQLRKGDGVLQAQLRALNISFEVRIPAALIEADLVGMQMLALVFIGIMMAASVIWVIACTRGATKPLDPLLQSLDNSRVLNSELADPEDKVYALARSIAQLDSRIESYEDIISTQQEHLRTRTLEKAMYRGLFDTEDSEAFHAAYPAFPRRWCMAHIQYTLPETTAEAEKLSFLFTEYLQHYLPQELLLTTGADSLVAILNADSAENPRALLERLRLDMERDYHLLFTFVLSSEYEDPQWLAAAYQQVEYESGAVLDPGITPRQQKMPLTYQQVQNMYIALSCGNETISLETLSECAQAIRKTPDYVLSKCAYRMIANMLVMVKLESACDLSDAVIPPFNQDDLTTLFEKQLPECFLLICQRVSAQRMTMSHDLINGMLTYIHENLGDPALSITALTEKFQISAPTLQKRLRAAVGQTFSAYVETARMNKARQELLETTRTVQEISESCGYTTPNSFHKAYKRCFGEAPLDIRQKG